MKTIIDWLDRHPRVCIAGAVALFLLAAALQELPGHPTTW